MSACSQLWKPLPPIHAASIIAQAIHAVGLKPKVCRLDPILSGKSSVRPVLRSILMPSTRRTTLPPIEVRRFTRQSADNGIRLLTARIADVNVIDPKTVLYSDQTVRNVEARIRGNILELFGENSQENREHHAYAIWGPIQTARTFFASERDVDIQRQQEFAAGIPQAVKMLEGLIETIRERTDSGRNEKLLDDLLPFERRAAFDNALPAMVAAANADRPLALIMIDIDHFKSVNDQHGHAAGDEVLRAVGNIVLGCVEEKGRPFRYGGEELVALLPNYAADEATALAERLRREVERAEIGPQRLKVTASLGVAVIPDHAADSPSLVDKADAAMYEAKSLGRNCVRVSGEPPPTESSARKVPRREPVAAGFASEQMSFIRSQYFKYRSAVCPKDGAALDVREAKPMGAAAVTLHVQCPMCGRHAKIEPD